MNMPSVLIFLQDVVIMVINFINTVALDIHTKVSKIVLYYAFLWSQIELYHPVESCSNTLLNNRYLHGVEIGFNYNVGSCECN